MTRLQLIQGDGRDPEYTLRVERFSPRGEESFQETPGLTQEQVDARAEICVSTMGPGDVVELVVRRDR